MIEKWEVSCFGHYNIQGVYCVFSYDIEKKSKELLYIGSSKNIGKRINSGKHPYKKLLNDGLNVFIKFKQTDNYIELEKKLIQKLKPIMNIQNIK